MSIQRFYTLEEITELDCDGLRLGARETFLMNLIRELADEIIKLKKEVKNEPVRIHSPA